MSEPTTPGNGDAGQTLAPVRLLDAADAKDAERFQWLIRQGVAWRDCYDRDWLPGEWLYAAQDARHFIDKAMAQASNSGLSDGRKEER